MKPWTWLVALLAMLTIAACGEDQAPEELLAEQRLEISRYAQEEGLTGQFTSEGLYYQILAGQDSAAEQPGLNQDVTVAYTGRFLNGEVFARVDSLDPLTIRLSQAIAGWRIGLPLTNEGATLLMILPSSLAYGENGQGAIPPNTILRYDLTLLYIVE